MQEEKKNTADPQADQPVAENAAEEQVLPEEAQQEDAPQEDAPQEETPAEAPAAEGGEKPAAEAAEQLSPKQRRKQARTRASAPGRPERSVEDRARERAEERARKAAARARWRARRREKRGAARTTGEQAVPTGTLQDGAAAEPGKRKVRQGVVVSSKGDKTITVRIDAVRRHRVYGKVVRETDTLHAHDEANQAGEGDIVRVMECRPLSRTKRWRLVDVLEKAR